MLSQSTQGTHNAAMLGEWKRQVGVLGPAAAYDVSTAASLIARGIVPPTPWDWKGQEDKRRYRKQLLSMAQADKARAEEWQQAASAVD